ncbi:ABC transporter substrate-binding protein [Streptomyces ardesiacus]
MKPLKTALIVATCLAIAAPLTACDSHDSSDATESSTAASDAASTDKGAFPYSFTECGKNYTFDHAPKILVDTPQAAALVAAAGGNQTGRIVAYTQGGDEPLGAAKSTMADVPQLSKTSPPSKEVILSADPDLVISHYLAPQLVSQLSDRGIQSMTVNNGCETYPREHNNHTGYDANYSDITLLGRLLGTSDYAATSVSAMKKSIAGLEAKARALPQHRVGMLTPYAGDLYAFGSTSIEHTELESLNMTNAFSELHGSFVPLSGEKLVDLNPWAIVVAYSPGFGTSEAKAKDALKRLPGADQLDAVKNNRVITIDDIYLTTLTADGLKMLYTELSKLN